MNKNCKNCNIELNENNIYPCFVKLRRYICKVCEMANSRKRYKEYRIIVIEKLGNKCDCCQENKFEVLSIDHINGGGGKESKKLRGCDYMKKLKNMDEILLKEKYRCLCFNCNYCIGFWGVCQHELL